MPDQLIRFHCAPEHAGQWPEPVPAKHAIPEWLKDTATPIAPHERRAGDASQRTVKACMPFLDAAGAGYIVPFPASVTVRYLGPDPVHRWDLRLDPADTPWIAAHSPGQYDRAPFANHPVLKLINPWIVATPPGISCLFVPPQSHFAPAGLLPLSGLVDTDRYYTPVNIPAVLTRLKPGSQVHIERGAPMIQVIPFRRESWSMEVGVRDEEAWRRTTAELEAARPDGYRQTFRSRKSYKGTPSKS